MVAILPLCARAQSMPGMNMPAHPPAPQQKPAVPAPMAGMDMAGKDAAGMDEAGMDAAGPMRMAPPKTLTEAILQHTSSGTSVEPMSTPMSMMMTERGHWSLMLHSNAFAADTQQQAANDRGHDAFFSTNWVMPMAQRNLGNSEITLRAMLSLEPATISHGSYPELFQQGETYNNRPIVDGQHPHDFVMELGALYDVPLPGRTLLTLYAAPVGDPAIGPTAYPHRESASEDPIAALGHHQQDSTHIAFNVMTLAFTHGAFRLEASGFHGAEPTDARWHFQPSPNGLTPDSFSGRLTFAPARNLAAQYSIAQITAPEALSPKINQRRQTASAMYNRPFADGNLAITGLWGQTKSEPPQGEPSELANSYLVETLVNFHRRDYIWTRIEVAARTSDLLTPAPPIEMTIGHVQAYTLGYDRDYRLGPHLLVAPGTQITFYAAPSALETVYGAHPYGGVVFLRFRLK